MGRLACEDGFDTPSSMSTIDNNGESIVKLRLPPPSRQKSKTKRQWLWTGLMGLIGAIVGYTGVSLFDDLFMKPNGILGVVFMILSIPIAWIVVVGWHEFGHVVGGWLTGGRFILWVAGPFMLRRTPAGLKWARNRSVNTGGGMAVCFPTDVNRITPQSTAVMILGGPVSSLLFTVLTIAICMIPTSAMGALTHNFLAISGSLSAFVFAITIFPHVAGGFKSDGKRAFDLLKGDERSDQEAAMLMLSSASLGGIRPSEYEPQLIERTLALNDGSLFDLNGKFIVYYHYADKGDWSKAQSCLDHVVDGEARLVPLIGDLARAEYAWLLATQSNSADAAAAWLATVGKLDFDPATRLRAEAAVAFAKGNQEVAQTKIDEARDALENRSMSPVISPFSVEALDQLESALRKAEPG